MSKSARAQSRAGRLLTYTLLILGVAVVALPFWYMAVTSLKPQAFIFEIPPRLWPSQATLDNYIKALGKDRFALYFLNSVIVATTATALTVGLSSMMAYAFSRLEFAGKEVVFYGLLLGMMIPPVMLIIPQFIIAKNLHLLDSLSGLILVYITMNLSVQTFLLRGFFDGIPRSLEEAALMDGANRWMIFRRVALPLVRPGLAVVAIFTFLYSWDEFPWANVAIKETAKRTLPIGIALFQSEHLTEWGQVFAASIVAIVPVVAVFVVFQRYFIRGDISSGIKG
ncbi:trehalose transport system permease protein SugB [bacterium BMS3Abin02]|nr:trehalose transport system permease protein SugB [bacterium BMS3Abin02]HDL49796.1 carbohydrate ABC transporter permease [Actinomycetota bacterium]